jgi:hypothetical protein
MFEAPHMPRQLLKQVALSLITVETYRYRQNYLGVPPILP